MLTFTVLLWWITVVWLGLYLTLRERHDRR